MIKYRIVDVTSGLAFIKYGKQKVGWMRKTNGEWSARNSDIEAKSTRKQEAFDMFLVAIGAARSVESLKHWREQRKNLYEDLDCLLDNGDYKPIRAWAEAR